jgi:hypothetical protein
VTSVLPAQCLACTRLRPAPTMPGLPRATPPVVTCDAYPSGIPVEIQRGGDHRQARGDEADGMVFELDADGEDAFEWWRRTFGLTDAERAQQRMTMDTPVVFTRPPDASVQ